ncbi:MAG: cell surface protein SprA [Bacteroidetes bacterium]|nr:cell surface protein SprA [Bacteroidota bacterium]
MANKAIKYTFLAAASATVLSAFIGTKAKERPAGTYPIFKEEGIAASALPADSPAVPTTKLKYNFKDESVQDPLYYPNSGGLKLTDPTNIDKKIDYDPVTGQYNISQKMGNLDYRPPTYMSPEEYMDYQIQKQVKSYWRQRTTAEATTQANRALIPKLHVSGELFDRIFGGNTVDIRPQGTAELIFGVNNSKTENPILPVKQRSITTFDFNEKIQLNVIGKIGDKLKLTTNYNTEATFDFENQMKIEYNGYEDEIIKKIEAGNVTLPLTGTLITGSTSLFGVKTQLQFGKLTATTIFSQQKGKKSEVNVTGGAQISKFEVTGDNYEANRHFFLSQYFRDRFDTALSKLPVIQSPVSVTKVEVWVTNRSSTTTDLRNIVAFSDLAEDSGHVSKYLKSPIIEDSTGYLPKNGANNLYYQMADSLVGKLRDRDFPKVSANLAGTPYVIARDYERIELARKLAPTEFTFNPRLGFISLNQSLNYDEVLAVAFQYSINGKTYQVGEFSTDGITSPKPLYIKLLKGTTVNPRLPIWDLMMKNIYSIGGYQINPQDFRLEVWYNNLSTGVDINFLPDGPYKGIPLVQVLPLDRLNLNGDATADGVFDFIDGVTISAANGRIIFPVAEPFGSYLYKKILGSPPTSDTLTTRPFAEKYAYKQLYDSTKTAAIQIPEKNRFKLKGSYKSSSSSEIALNTVNVPQGSVTVTAGGIKLTENIDYTVDYTLGRVKIINEGILNSGTPIKISLESNSLFALQSKTMIGAHFDYRVNKDFILGSTIMRLTERPLTQKVNIGDEPISNTVVGLDGNYKTEVPFITKLVDKLPFISTKQPSNLVASGEVAKLFPGHNKAIGKDGNSYIDDFEGSISRIDIKSPQAWSLASIPQGQPGLFPEASLNDSLPAGFNRARLNWYIIDPLLLRNTPGLTPGNLGPNEMSDNFTREVLETEIFPNKQLPSGTPTNTPVFDLAYYPQDRGPYNYDVTGLSGISSGIDVNGKLNNPKSRWGGIMRQVVTNDFEATNIEYIQFWMMDPFNADNINPNTTGDLYVNLGNISEDVLKDSRKAFENGLPIDGSNSTNIPYDETKWGRVPAIQSIVNAFDVNEAARPYQDVGLDGLTNGDENSFFNSSYIQKVSALHGATSAAYLNAVKDPSGDDYHFYRGSDYDNTKLTVLERYRQYNGPDGNSPASGQANHEGLTESYTTSATSTPTSEDINRDNTLSESEGYFQYRLSLRPSDFNAVGQNYITDILSTSGQNIKNGTTKPIKWYQIKIPIREFETKVGSIEDFRSIRFIRMFFKGVDKPIVCRFARMEFIRGEWRTYNNSLLADGEYLGTDGRNASFQTAAINIEENGTRAPVNYVLPPGIDRQVNIQSSNLARLNEQALSMRVCGLEDGNARAAFRTTSLDIRMYKKLKMFVHAEAGPNGDALNDGDLRVFIRLGSDFSSNYYEYEIPLKVTAPKNYNGGNQADQYAVWPLANELDLEFAKLQSAKQQRNIALTNGTATAKLNIRYMVSDGSNNIYIMGNPNLAGVKTIMIGIRNPKQQPGSTTDDGLAKCGEVWVNELRLSDFDEQGGWASIARIKTDLADLGSISIAGNYSTPGWGGIEKKVNERQQSTNYGYDLSSNIELGKFTPSTLNIKIPMYFGYSESFIVPRFNPLDPDINLKEVLSDQAIPQTQRDSLSTVTVDYTRRKSLNFTNVKKDKGKNKKTSHIYDIENVALSYSFSEIFHRDINIEYNTTRTYKAGLTWSFSPTAKSIKPFDKIKLNPKYFSLIKDLNFSLLPNRLGFTTDVDRFYNESKIRNNTGSSDVIIIPLYNKTFNMNRSYDLKWDLTKALKVDFTANNQGRIMEPVGRIDTQEKRDTVIDNLLGLGLTTKYRHSLNVNYTIPINKLPMLDFVNASVRYSGTYDWTRAPFAADSLGHIIQNSGSWQWNGQFNMSTLYNKIPYFKKLSKKPLGGIKPDEKQKAKEKAEAEKAAAATKDMAKLKLKLKSLSKDTSGANKAAIDSLKAKILKADTLKPKKKENQYEILDYIGRLVTSVKNITLSYTDNAGTTLPGYSQKTNIMGMDSRFEGPTPGFIFGSQADIRQKAIDNDWLEKTASINTPYTNNRTQNITARVNIEPLPDFKIEVNGNRNYSETRSEFFRWDGLSKSFQSQTPTFSGSFSISFLSIRTAFEKRNKTHFSQNWENFLNYRATISNFQAQKYTLAQLKQDTSGFMNGYGAISQDVTIPAFVAAYAGRAPRKNDLTTFPLLPMPNWRITYDGLSKMEIIKTLFRSITLSHSYRSTYNVTSFTQNLNFVDNGDGLTTVRDATSNFVPRLTIGSVSISEQFSPLLKIDMTWNNSLLTSFEIRKERNLSLAMSNIQLQELNSRDIVIGAGYRIKDLKIKLGKRAFKSDLNLKADISFKNNITVMRQAATDITQATSGQNIITIKTSADYILNDKLTVRAFFDRIMNRPVISSSFPTSNTNAGISLRFTLAQ